MQDYLAEHVLEGKNLRNREAALQAAAPKSSSTAAICKVFVRDV
jgi:hypothetical protein